jgi:flagellar hook assembly protein FlgD
LVGAGQVSVVIYDVLGYRVVELSFGSGANGGRAGDNAVHWDGKDSGGGFVESGVYWLVVTPIGEKARKIRIGVSR